jgi:hypothetical protein
VKIPRHRVVIRRRFSGAQTSADTLLVCYAPVSVHMMLGLLRYWTRYKEQSEFNQRSAQYVLLTWQVCLSCDSLCMRGIEGTVPCLGKLSATPN